MIKNEDFKVRALEAVRQVRIACDKAEKNLREIEGPEILEKQHYFRLLSPLIQVVGAVGKETMHLDKELAEALEIQEEKHKKHPGPAHKLLEKEGEVTKTKISRDEFIVICNQELRNHPDFKDGMEIIGEPKGYSGSDLSGYSWTGPEYMPDIVAMVVKIVEEKYECV